MIDITKYLNEGLIIPDLSVATKEEAIKALTARVFRVRKAADFPLNEENVFEAVMKRERLQTTGIGNSLAFPHARIEGWKEFSLAMAVCRNGLDFASTDGVPVKVIFLLISSHDEPYIILQTMATIIRFMIEGDHFSWMLREGLSSGQIIEKFRESGIEAPEQILARDIARPVTNYVTIETSIEKATRIMHLNQLDVLPVLDDKKKYCGEISCLNIFEYGMPNFFKKLNTISFVKHIDPFEKYFKIKGDLKVGDLYEKGDSDIGNDATLLEVIFAMTVKQKSKLFVVEKNGQLTGVIDRFCVIDKILFF